MKPKELKHIAPTLVEIQNNGTGFKLPKNYFKEIENKVFGQLFLTSLPTKLGHQVPKDYFEQVENQITSKLQLNKNTRVENDLPVDYFENFEDKLFKRLASEKETKVFSLKKYWIPVAIAASLLLFISIYNPFKEDKSLDIAEIEAWIEEGNLDLNSYEMADLYDFEMDNIAIKPNLNTNDIEDYLLEEIDESIFYN
ncbi:MAG TPA: hypothetical protein EYG92_11535 [Lutibacter sp.]|nr:hypothetical protein [Lutibacter sp.]